jgi:hypothetical protein
LLTKRVFARFIKFAVNPLLNSAGCHAHEVRVRLASRDCFVNLELPFPQSRFHLRDGEFNTSAVHLCSPPDMPSRATQSPILPNPVVGSDASLARCSQAIAFIRYMSIRLQLHVISSTRREPTNLPHGLVFQRKKQLIRESDISGKWKVFLYIGGAGPVPA